jgi:pyruvate/2-oxoglutarate dehydrogenase complex dihydrolipoamide dehydrogenase (E3) component
LLAKRIAHFKYNSKPDMHYINKHTKLDYKLVPTTVFTPNEYSCCGLSEAQAIEKYGKDKI